MPKIDYAAVAAGANAALLDAGGPVTIIQAGTDDPVYVPGVGMTQPADVETSCTGAVFEFSLTQAGSSFAPGTLIQAGDQHLILSPEGVPAGFGAGDRVTAFGAAYSVVAVKKTAPAGVPVLYEALLRL